MRAGLATPELWPAMGLPRTQAHQCGELDLAGRCCAQVYAGLSDRPGTTDLLPATVQGTRGKTGDLQPN